MPNRSVLISGIGIAGPTLAYWLLESGFAPTLVERAPRLRTGGYIIDFWGLGYDVISAGAGRVHPQQAAGGGAVRGLVCPENAARHLPAEARTFRFPAIANLVIGRSLLDRLELPAYSMAHGAG